MAEEIASIATHVVPWWISFWTPIVATVALVQPWIIALLKRYVRRGKVEIYPVGLIDIQFANWGPTVAVLGTIRGLHQELFVEAIRATVTRLSDSAKLDLEWKFFRPNSEVLGEEKLEVEMVGGFQVTPTAPKKFNLVLASEKFIGEFTDRARVLENEWRAFVVKEIGASGREREILADPNASNELFTKFYREERTPSAFFRDLDLSWFWRASTYSLDFHVDCAPPARSATATWGFSLNKDEEQRLRLNNVMLQRSLCGLQVHFATVLKARITPGTA